MTQAKSTELTPLLYLYSSDGQYQVRYACHDTYTLVSQYTLGIATQPKNELRQHNAMAKKAVESFNKSLQVVM